MNEATHVISVFVGIDVSKHKLDCPVLLNGKIKSKVVSNDRPAMSELARNKTDRADAALLALLRRFL